MKKIFLFSCIILLFSQCVFNLEGKWHSIDFYNKSGKPICYLLSLNYFLFYPDTLAKYDWETIRKDYKILIRYDLSRQDLKKLDWCFYYPPTEEMKGMKMFPPYKK